MEKVSYHHIQLLQVPDKVNLSNFMGRLRDNLLAPLTLNFHARKKDSIFSISLETDSKKIEIYEELENAYLEIIQRNLNKKVKLILRCLFKVKSQT